MVRHILRDAALPLTWLLLHTPVTANQVTLFALLTGLTGITLISLTSHSCFLAGMLLVQLWYFLDHVDGQIARYRKTASLTGRFFDFLVHHIIHGVFFLGLAFYVYQKTGHVIFLFWGFLTSLSLIGFNSIHDIKCKAFVEKLLSGETFSRRVAATKSMDSGSAQRSLLQRTFSLLHKLSEIHVLMNIFTSAAVLQVYLSWGLDFRYGLFLFYGSVIPFLFTIKTVHFILTKKIDEEFEAIFSDD